MSDEHETDENMQKALDTLELATTVMRNLQVLRAGGAPIPEELHQPLIQLTWATVAFATVLYNLPPRELFDTWFKAAPGRESWEQSMATLQETYRTTFLPLLEAETNTGDELADGAGAGVREDPGL